jgi:hypothetical protein
MVAKMEGTVNGGPPPGDGRSVHYLDQMRSVDRRRLVVADSDAYRYMISLLSPALPKSGR